MMMKSFIELLSCALWGRKLEKSLNVNEFKTMIQHAEQQTVLGLSFDVLKDMRVEGPSDRKLVMGAMAKTEKIKLQNSLVNKELADFADKCNRQETDYLVVKGQTIGCLYPKPELRQAGDVDFLFPTDPTIGCDEDYECQRVRMSQIFPEVKLPPKMKEYEVEFKHNGVLYELHTSLRKWAKKRHQKIWDELMEHEWRERHYVEIDGVKVRTLSPTMNAAYVFIHLFFHFIREGVSLRQLCDWTMVLHHYKDEIDKERLLKILSDLDLSDAYCAFGTILTDHLGLPVKEFPLPLGDKGSKWQEMILKDIIGGGNFGKLHHQAHNSWKFKIETMQIAVRNSFRYYSLCPSEIGGMIPRLIKGNMRILVKI